MNQFRDEVVRLEAEAEKARRAALQRADEDQDREEVCESEDTQFGKDFVETARDMGILPGLTVYEVDFEQTYDRHRRLPRSGLRDWDWGGDVEIGRERFALCYDVLGIYIDGTTGEELSPTTLIVEELPPRTHWFSESIRRRRFRHTFTRYALRDRYRGSSDDSTLLSKDMAIWLLRSRK